MTPTTAGVFVSHTFPSMYSFFFSPSSQQKNPGPFSKGFPQTQLPGKKSHLFWNQGKKDKGEMQTEQWEFTFVVSQTPRLDENNFMQKSPAAEPRQEGQLFFVIQCRVRPFLTFRVRPGVVSYSFSATQSRQLVDSLFHENKKTNK